MKTVLIGMLVLSGAEARDKRMLRNKTRNNLNKMGRVENKAVQAEDVMFWMRDLQMGSMPSKPSGANTPSPSITFTSFPTKSASGDDMYAGYGDDAYAGYGDDMTDDINVDSSFKCPPASFVGCTAPDPKNPIDECPAVGEPCTDGNPGEYCCRDGCPRQYCTAKEFIGDDGFQTPQPTMVDTPQPTLKVTPAPTFKCNINSNARRTQLTNIIASVSTRADLNSANTPQNLALNWLVDDDLAQLCPSTNADERDAIIQRYVLALFYYSTNGSDPVNNPTWKQCTAPNEFTQEGVNAANSGCDLTTTNSTQIFPDDIRGKNAWLGLESECTWGGVSCYPDSSSSAGKINAIEFENNGIEGTLPEEIEQLDEMRWFSSERGVLSGSIPSTIGNLQKLLLLDMDFNELSGPLPDAMWQLTQLRQLDLNDNQLTGTLSESIGNLSELRFFQIDNNGLSGTIPGGLGDAVNFGLIGLSGNNLVGAMPSVVCDLRPSPLQTLVVDCNIECSIPDCCTSCVP